MARSAAVSTGQVEETVIQKRTIDASEVDKAPGYGQEIDEYMAGLSPEDWTDHIVYLYRKFPQSPTGKNTYIDKFAHAFDEAWLQEHHGGGVYHYILKKGSQRIKEGDTPEIAGRPKLPGYLDGGNGNGMGATSTAAPSELVEALRLVINERKNPAEQFNFDLMKQGMLNALDIQRAAAAVPAAPPVTLESLTQAMKNMKELTGNSSGMPDWMGEIGKVVIPALGALVVKLLEPKDPLTTIKGTVETMGALSALAGGGGNKTDWATVLVQQGPSLLSHFASVMAEIRAAEQLRQQNLILANKSENPPVLPAVHATPARPTVQVNPTPPIDQSHVQTGKPSPEWILGRIVSMCTSGAPGGFAVDFLMEVEPDFVIGIKAASLEQIKELIAGHPILKACMESPNYERFLAEFFAALHEGEIPAQPPTQRPN